MKLDQFTWTAKRDARLRELMREGVSATGIAYELRCRPSEVTARWRQISRRKPAGAPDVSRVPRPVAAPAACAPRPGRVLIDLRNAPSAMEQRAAGWRGR